MTPRISTSLLRAHTDDRRLTMVTNGKLWNELSDSYGGTKKSSFNEGSFWSGKQTKVCWQRVNS